MTRNFLSTLCNRLIVPGSLFVMLLVALATPGAATTACNDDCKAQMLLFAYIANLSDNTPAEHRTQVTKERIQCALNGGVSELRQGWKAVWGPVVRGVIVSNNTMYVAQYKATNTYVVAIAGTNPKSQFDWFFEDLNIDTILWPEQNSPSGPRITEATWTGLEVLKNMKPKSATNEKLSLLEFLKGVARRSAPSDKATIYVTGHSLGGALAPALALWLSDHRGGLDGWDPLLHTTLQVYAFAGATPGDKGFAEYMHTKFPGDPGGDTLTQDGMSVIYNTRDIVPNAFNLENLKKIHDLYASLDIYPSASLKLVLDSVIKKVNKAKNGGIEYFNLGQGSQIQAFDGRLVPVPELQNLEKPPCIPVKNAYIKKKNHFTFEALYQHVCAYPQELRLSKVFEDLKSCTRKYP